MKVKRNERGWEGEVVGLFFFCVHMESTTNYWFSIPFSISLFSHLHSQGSTHTFSFSFSSFSTIKSACSLSCFSFEYEKQLCHKKKEYFLQQKKDIKNFLQQSDRGKWPRGWRDGNSSCWSTRCKDECFSLFSCPLPSYISLSGFFFVLKSQLMLRYKRTYIWVCVSSFPLLIHQAVACPHTRVDILRSLSLSFNHPPLTILAKSKKKQRKHRKRNKRKK